MKVHFTLNNRPCVFDVDPGEYLLTTLRNHNYTEVKNGCDASSCGACTVLLNGKPVLACTLLTMRVDGQSITTVTGLQMEIEKIANCFADEGADQCGFCNTGAALTIYALKREIKNPSDEDIRRYMVGNLCRCSGYQAQFKAIKRYLEEK
jgi:aerobic carbon-monoxide dehydrogenase small subunit